MKVVLLAGGFGTRLAEMTDMLPKPMVTIGGHPILWHIMNIYATNGFRDFILALGYKADVVKKFFLDYSSLNADFTVDMASGNIDWHTPYRVNWRVTLVDTGIDTMTGGRVRRLREHLSGEPFMLTYGDGVADIDLGALLEFHRSHGKMVTVTTVHPAARFGELDMDGAVVRSFKEKPQTGLGWINGGFFVMQPEFLDLIADDATILEREPMEQVAARGELMAFRHEGFWQCMDTVRDRNYLEDLWRENRAPWKQW
ncbi:MAG: glucose-1-phosphate cytidylyltransferase [Magnetococcales bacterium]|nr:glucose-1-phosphate cytidylyltransferase [Magnetococcales bacterium]MBF0110696.1 glucose-1-phosphate cytidylyltransferase [Magnetococcales bacterium]MBF0116749.1 glucose-1-phosphate cytidylyltransferase [Magnetococcales bacterium]